MEGTVLDVRRNSLSADFATFSHCSVFYKNIFASKCHGALRDLEGLETGRGMCSAGAKL